MDNVCTSYRFKRWGIVLFDTQCRWLGRSDKEVKGVCTLHATLPVTYWQRRWRSVRRWLLIGGGGVAEISAVAARPAQRKALSAKPEVKEWKVMDGDSLRMYKLSSLATQLGPPSSSWNNCKKKNINLNCCSGLVIACSTTMWVDLYSNPTEDFVFIVTGTVIYSLGHGLCTFTAMPSHWLVDSAICLSVVTELVVQW